MDVSTWLRNLGLGQYEQTFRENDIDAEVLAELTPDDLSGLGIRALTSHPPTLEELMLRHYGDDFSANGSGTSKNPAGGPAGQSVLGLSELRQQVDHSHDGNRAAGIMPVLGLSFGTGPNGILLDDEVHARAERQTQAIVAEVKEFREESKAHREALLALIDRLPPG